MLVQIVVTLAYAASIVLAIIKREQSPLYYGVMAGVSAIVLPMILGAF